MTNKETQTAMIETISKYLPKIPADKLRLVLLLIYELLKHCPEEVAEA